MSLSSGRPTGYWTILSFSSLDQAHGSPHQPEEEQIGSDLVPVGAVFY